MPHPRGKRSKNSEKKRQQRRDARHYILTHSFHDRELAETVCTPQTRSLTILALQHDYDAVDMHLVNVEKGEVLIDARGRGSFQEMTLLGGR